MKSIITNKKVDKTFEGEECLLKRTIVKVIKERTFKKYIILTERCNYYEEEVQKVDSETGELLFDENQNPIIETVNVLRSLGKKDKEGVLLMTFDEINVFSKNISSLISSSIIDEMDIENTKEQYALLQITKDEKAWGTKEDDWILLNE